MNGRQSIGGNLFLRRFISWAEGPSWCQAGPPWPHTLSSSKSAEEIQNAIETLGCLIMLTQPQVRYMYTHAVGATLRGFRKESE